MTFVYVHSKKCHKERCNNSVTILYICRKKVKKETFPMIKKTVDSYCATQHKTEYFSSGNLDLLIFLRKGVKNDDEAKSSFLC